MDLSQITEVCHNYFIFFENFESLVKSLLDELVTQMPIFLLFVSPRVLFDGAFSL